MNKLKPFKSIGGIGIPDQFLNNFSNDNNLKKAINRALPALYRIKKNGIKLKNTTIQKDILNFYDNNSVVPYSPLAAQGPWIIEKNGSILYDVGGYGMLGFGHCPEWALKVLKKPHVMANLMTPNNIHYDFVEEIKTKIGVNRIDKKCPYSHFTFLNSGSEAMDFSLRLSDINRNDTIKPSAFIVLKNGFHGRTYGASLISDSCNVKYKKYLKSYNIPRAVFNVEINKNGDLLNEFHKIQNEYQLDAVVMEPVMGEGNPGQMLSKDFYNEARELTKKAKANFIIDSVQAGIRTSGYLSVVDYPHLKDVEAPDIEIFSKAINSGQYPLSVIAVTNDIVDRYKTGIYGNTMTGNPKALEIGIETLKRVTPELSENIRDKGAKFVNMLNNVKKHYPFIATHVTGQGLLCALHIKEHYPVVADVNGLEYLCRKNGLNVIHGGKNALRFTPNFNITDEEIELVEKILFYTFEQFTNNVIRI